MTRIQNGLNFEVGRRPADKSLVESISSDTMPKAITPFVLFVASVVKNPD